MIKVTHYSLLCGVLTLAACAEPAPPTDDPAAQGVETAMADAAAPRSADGRYAVGDRLKVKIVPGCHASILDEPYVIGLANALQASLDDAQS